jgi:capsular exopolysaccharide synthesis family protein
MVAQTILSAERLQEMQNEIEVLDRLIADLDATYARMLSYLEVPQGDNYLAIVEPAQAKTDPVEPRTRYNMLLGMLIGLALAAGLVLLWDQLDDTIKSGQDIGKELAIATVGSVILPKGRSLPQGIASWHGTDGPAAEDYRLISTKIQYMASSWARKVIVMTSTIEGPNKSIVLANLAVALAETGLRVILIDADLRNPVQQRIFEVSNRAGLTDLLRISALDPATLLLATPEPNLRLLPSGDLPTSPAEYLASRQMDTLLAKLSKDADMILCDCAQAVTLADAPALSTYANGVLLFLESGKSQRDSALQALQNLQQAGANVVGAVLCTTSSRSTQIRTSQPQARANLQQASPRPGA